MLKTRLTTILARSLFLAAAMTALAACGDGAGGSSSVPDTGGKSAILPRDASDPGTAGTTAAYTWHGCQVYPVNDWFTTDLIAGGSAYVSNSVDPNSENIIANLASAWPGAHFNGSSSTYEDEAANAATNDTPLLTLQNTTIKDDPYSDDPNNKIPWRDGFLSEGTAGCRWDCHSIVVNTQTCVDYETYWFGRNSWNGYSFAAGNGYVHNLNHPFDEQYANDSGTVSAGGLPMMGTTDFGEDASLPSINHIIALIMPGTDAGRNGSSGYVAPATNRQHCAMNCANGLPNGARLRLRADYPCPDPGSNPQANLVCNQLKHYGTILDDVLGYGHDYAFRFGETSDGSNPWNQGDLSALLDNLRITDFDVMTLGTIHNW